MEYKLLWAVIFTEVPSAGRVWTDVAYTCAWLIFAGWVLYLLLR